MWIKICGTTNREDALAAVNAGANAIGFIFAPSPRRITPEKARDIAASLPAAVEKVGVFVNETAERIRDIAEQAGLTAVQLQGDEDYPLVINLKRLLPNSSVYKAVAVSRYLDAVATSGFGVDIRFDLLTGVLLDSGTVEQRGGSGQRFDWSLAAHFFGPLGMHTRLIVAGGLNAENVAEAIRLFRPYGVDVCSGTEASPGKKDHAKVRAFVDAVRACEKTAVT